MNFPHLAMNNIIDLDKWLFVKINKQGANYLFDQFMPWMRVPAVWAPLYLFLIFFIILNYKKALPWILTIAATVALTDLISSHFIKSWVGRLRPCNDIEMLPNI